MVIVIVKVKSFIKICMLSALLLGFFTLDLAAEVKLPEIISTHMVLQSEKPVPIWGTAKPGENVTVSFAGQTKEVVAAKDGRWMVLLDPMKVSNESRKFTVKGENTIVVEDVIVGEVWFCAGQSNMAYGFKSYNQKERPIKSDKLLRYFTPTKPHWRDKKKLIPGKWVAGGNNFSSVAVNFGARLRAEINRPVGMLSSWKGGGNIELWLEYNGCNMFPELKAHADFLKRKEANPLEKMDRKLRGVASYYKSTVKNQIPFAIRGAIWYQGEGNGGEGDSYRIKMAALIKGWRKTWHDTVVSHGIKLNEIDPFYFAFVQLANFGDYSNDDPEGGHGWVGVWEAQRKSLEIENTGMAVIADLGLANDIHPKNKYDVGNRLALWPLAQVYKKKIVYSGPLYKGFKVEGKKIRLIFDHTGTGLIVGKKEGLNPTQEIENGKLARFAIAGEDKKWFWAEAVIDGKDVVVSSDNVKKPVAVRFAWTQNPVGINLYNKEGLLASPFRTDTWDMPKRIMQKRQKDK